MEKFTLIYNILNKSKINELINDGYSKIQLIECINTCKNCGYITINYDFEITDEGMKYYERKKREYKLNRILK